ncbi:MAG: T9SS type A sorting domain-containing protein [Candidatus Delongbacteria bacterium]
MKLGILLPAALLGAVLTAAPARAAYDFPGAVRPAHLPVGHYYGWLSDAPDVLISGAGDNCVVWKDLDFSLAQLQAAGSALLSLGFDDGAQVWINGQNLMDLWWDAHGVGYWNAQLDLRPYLSVGRNRLVVRVFNACYAGSGEGGLDMELMLGGDVVFPNGSTFPQDPRTALWYDGGDCGWGPPADARGLDFTQRDYGWVDETVGAVDTPRAFSLAPAFPNPFNPATTLSYTLAATGAARLAVYDLAGRQVAVLADGLQAAGTHQLNFDAAGLPAGLYLARLEADGHSQTQKLLLVK